MLYGKGYIEDDTLRTVSFRISSRSFYQVNPVQTEKLYGKALELAELTGKETVWMLIAVLELSVLLHSKQAGKVIGVELNQDAVRDASAATRRMNGITNAQFLLQ